MPIDLRPGDRVYLDTNAFIFTHERKLPGLVGLFRAIDAGRYVGVTSELALAELLVGPFKSGQLALVARYERVFSPQGGLEVLPIDFDLFRRGARVQATIGGRLPDAVHVAAAVQASCRCIVTTDAQMRTLPSAPLLLPSDMPSVL